MFPTNIWFAYTAACLLLVLSPGPDNLMAIGRGLSQGRLAATVSGFSSGIGILFHVTTASLGLTLLIQTSAVAFWIVKLVGAAYLLWLGIKVLRSRSLINFEPTVRQSLHSIFPHRFFVSSPQSQARSLCVGFHTSVYQSRAWLGDAADDGLWRLVCLAYRHGLFTDGHLRHLLSTYIRTRPRLSNVLNLGAGVTFIASGLSIAVLGRK